jgi:predicted cupin superfamily sugar epimerase
MKIATPSIENLIRKLELEPHPEGGFYRRTYQSQEQVTRTDGRQRHASTGIHYLLHGAAYSAWHRIDADEMWHYYAGDSLLIHMLDQHGDWKIQRLGNLLTDPNAVFQFVVPAGCWFAAEREGTQGYVLTGCTVAPGFEFSAFELADLQVLLNRYPQHEPVIRRLAPNGSDC